MTRFKRFCMTSSTEKRQSLNGLCNNTSTEGENFVDARRQENVCATISRGDVSRILRKAAWRGWKLECWGAVVGCDWIWPIFGMHADVAHASNAEISCKSQDKKERQHGPTLCINWE
jgi:hypothetical protein